MSNFKLQKKVNLFFFLVIILLAFQTSSQDYLISKNLQSDNKDQICVNALEWYQDNPQLKGEYQRVLDYCKKYAKDLSTEKFLINPILSDFGAMNGVNTRPRDHIHQGIDIIGSKNEPIIAIADGESS